LSLLTHPAVLPQNACGSVQHVRQDLTTKLEGQKRTDTGGPTLGLRLSPSGLCVSLSSL
jgi:hypothetical protein